MLDQHDGTCKIESRGKGYLGCANPGHALNLKRMDSKKQRSNVHNLLRPPGRNFGTVMQNHTQSCIQKADISQVQEQAGNMIGQRIEPKDPI